MKENGFWDRFWGVALILFCFTLLWLIFIVSFIEFKQLRVLQHFETLLEQAAKNNQPAN